MLSIRLIRVYSWLKRQVFCFAVVVRLRQMSHANDHDRAADTAASIALRSRHPFDPAHGSLVLPLQLHPVASVWVIVPSRSRA